MLLLGDNGASEGDWVCHQQICPARRGGEVCVTILQMGKEAFPEEEIRPTLRIHDTADHGMIFWVNIGAGRVEGNSLTFDQRAIIRRGNEDRMVAAVHKLACYAEIGVYVSQRAQAGDDDALTHA